jgi:hypothetical protein
MLQYMFDIKKNEEEIVIQMLQDSSVGPPAAVGLQRHLIGFIVIKVRYRSRYKICQLVCFSTVT